MHEHTTNRVCQVNLETIGDVTNTTPLNRLKLFADSAFKFSNVTGKSYVKTCRDDEINGNRNGSPMYDANVDPATIERSDECTENDIDKCGHRKKMEKEKTSSKLVGIFELVGSIPWKIGI